MKWTIDKEFHWEMGHRVWAKKLDHPELSIETECACKHLHGHSYVLKVFLGADQLDQSAMVTDFKNLNFMKKFVDEVLDHKFLIDKNDPHFELITGAKPKVVEEAPNFSPLTDFYKPNNEQRKEHAASFIVVDFVPTSENICAHLKDWAQNQIGNVATVVAVELWETKKSHCRYE